MFFLLLVLMAGAVISNTEPRTLVWREASNTELMGHYRGEELCFIAKLATEVPSKLSPTHVKSLSWLLKLQYCANITTLPDAWERMKTLSGPSIAGGGDRNFHYQPLKLNYSSGKHCGISHIDRLPIWTSKFDLPKASREPIEELTDALKMHGVERMLWFGDSFSQQVINHMHHEIVFHELPLVKFNNNLTLPCGLVRVASMARRPGAAPTTNNTECTHKLNADWITEKVSIHLKDNSPPQVSTRTLNLIKS